MSAPRVTALPSAPAPARRIAGALLDVPLLAAAAIALLAAGCADTPARVRCHRYEAAAFTAENRYAAVVDAGLPWIDGDDDRIDLSMFVLRRTREPVELVHVVGGREMGRWSVDLPPGRNALAICTISPVRSDYACTAKISELPHPTDGYFYLALNGNDVPEAGLSFHLCSD